MSLPLAVAYPPQPRMARAVAPTARRVEIALPQRHACSVRQICHNTPGPRHMVNTYAYTRRHGLPPRQPRRIDARSLRLAGRQRRRNARRARRGSAVDRCVSRRRVHHAHAPARNYRPDSRRRPCPEVVERVADVPLNASRSSSMSTIDGMMPAACIAAHNSSAGR